MNHTKDYTDNSLDSVLLSKRNDEVYQYGDDYYIKVDRVSGDKCHMVPIGSGRRWSGTKSSVPLVWKGTADEFLEIQTQTE